MQLKGKIHSVGQTQQVTESFKKRSLILETADNPQYPQYITVEASQDKVSLFDGLNVGQEVEIDTNLNGRLWTNKEGVEVSFNVISAWKVTKIGDVPAPVDISSDDGDPLPF